jgi:serine/threonine protein kinase
MSFQIPGYELVEPPIGQGGFGRVYKARERSNVALLRAVKVIDPIPFHDLQQALARFEREAKALSSLDHRAIIRYVVSGVTDSEPRHLYLVTEFVEGASFRSDAGLSDVEFVEKMAEVLDALSYAHQNGIIHRDVKPPNLMIRTSDGQPLILDFGLALFLDESGTPLTTRYAGSMGYVPPEVLSGEQKSSVNHDIFSCAVTLYEALAGRRPDIQKPEPLSSIRPELASLDPVIRQGLAPAATRFKTASEFASALRDAAKRLQATKELSTSNSTAEVFLRKAIERREEQRRRQIESEQRKAAAASAWSSWDSLVNPAAKQAFVDMLNAAKALDDEYAFEELPKSTNVKKGNVVPILRLHRKGKPGEIVFGLSTTAPKNPLGIGVREEMAVQWPDTSRMSGALPRVPEGTLLPSWIVFDQGLNQSPLRTLYGALVAAQFAGESEHRLFARPTAVFSRNPAHLLPQELKTPEEIRKYVTEAIGRALGLGL